MDKDSFKRTVSLTNVVREICEVCPFEENDEAILKDRKLYRYLLLSLPVMQKIVNMCMTAGRQCHPHAALQVPRQPLLLLLVPERYQSDPKAG